MTCRLLYVGHLQQEGDDQNENDRWVIENDMLHFQVIPIMHTVC